MFICFKRSKQRKQRKLQGISKKNNSLIELPHSKRIHLQPIRHVLLQGSVQILFVIICLSFETLLKIKKYQAVKPGNGNYGIKGRRGARLVKFLE
jgi:hypothetical protein